MALRHLLNPGIPKQNEGQVTVETGRQRDREVYHNSLTSGKKKKLLVSPGRLVLAADMQSD